MDYRLLYRGKKIPLKLDMPQISGPYIFEGEPVWVDERSAKWLMENNPLMFVKVDERSEAEPVVEDPVIKQPPKPQEKEKQPPRFKCKKCGKGYERKGHKDRHQAKCDG